MWQSLLDVLFFLLRWNFYLGAAVGTALFFYLWYQEVKTGPNRWPRFASDTEYVVLCALCFIPVVNFVAIFAAFFLVAMTWDLPPPKTSRSI